MLGYSAAENTTSAGAPSPPPPATATSYSHLLQPQLLPLATARRQARVFLLSAHCDLYAAVQIHQRLLCRARLMHSDPPFGVDDLRQLLGEENE